MRREAHASLKNASKVFLSRTSLDLGPRVSHHTANYHIETGQLSLLHWLMWVYSPETGESRSRARWPGVVSPVRGRECGPDVAACSLVPLLAVSEAENVVLRSGINAANVVLKMRCLQSRCVSIAVRYR